MGIQEQIEAALNGRKAQRPLVEDLARNWTALTTSFRSLADAAQSLADDAASTHPADRKLAEVFGQLDRTLAGRGKWQAQATEVSRSLDDCAAKIAILHNRVHRETVNIGVVGTTGAGKSTLLRKLSGLGLEQIPSNDLDSSTATPSRIFHRAGVEQQYATLYMHTWDTFRDEVLDPLHESAKLGKDAPVTLEDFRRFDYDNARVPPGAAGAERYLKRLRRAHDSLRSYERLLGTGERHIALNELRPFVAYPPDRTSTERPYHAVRSADIYCRFPDLDAIHLALVDLPGAGEAGLDVHGRFLASLQNQTDVLFVVKRPDKSPATDQDWDAKQLADSASAGVRLSDFAFQVINRDKDLPGEFFDAAIARVKAEGGQLAPALLLGDLRQDSSETVTRKILGPVLGHLAARLASMDHDAISYVLSDLAGTAAKVRDLVGQLEGYLGRWTKTLPDEERRHRARVRSLKNQVALELWALIRTYDELRAAGAPIAELQDEIVRAGETVTGWLAGGLGEGSETAWHERFTEAVAGSDVGDELDRRYNGARNQVVEAFRPIDNSLEDAIDRLFGEVADALRRKLTDKIVPAGPENSVNLEEFASYAAERGAVLVSDAITELLQLRDQYGSIFLRVGRPIIRQIDWASGDAGPVADADADADAAGGGAAGSGPSWLIDDDEPLFASPPPAASDPPVVGLANVDLRDPAVVYPRLTATVADVTGKLQGAFRAEADRTTVILAAAIDLLRDSTTTVEDIELEFERLTSEARREIWEADFAEAASEVTAGILALREQAKDTEAEADQAISLVRRL